MDFNFDEWLTASKLSARSREELVDGECIEFDDLCEVTGDEVAKFDISLCQRHRLLAALKLLRQTQAETSENNQASVGGPLAAATRVTHGASRDASGNGGGGDGDDEPPGVAAVNRAALRRAGECLDGVDGLNLGRDFNFKNVMDAAARPNHGLGAVNAQMAIPPSTPSLMFNPCDALYLKSCETKCVHILDHVHEEVKLCIQKRKKGRLVLGQNDEIIHDNSMEQVSYLGISLDEWGGASIRVMYHLLQMGQISRAQTDTYQAYTVSIFDMYAHNDWHSILTFDARYRELQARTGCDWGTMGEQLKIQYLKPRTGPAPSGEKAKFHTQKGKANGKVVKSVYKPAYRQLNEKGNSDMCIQWALGKCRFGEEECRFRHADNVPPKN